MILGVDSSQPLLSVALVDGERTLGAATVRGEASRNEKLLPMVDWLLREAGVERHDLRLLAVTRGPGSFTGLRIGLATVQGIARASSAVICAMSTLQAAAFDGGSLPVLVTSDAGRGELYAAAYRGLDPVREPEIVSEREAEDLARSTDRRIDLRVEGDAINVALRAARFARAAELAGRLGEWDAAVPLYVRLAEPDARMARAE